MTTEAIREGLVVRYRFVDGLASKSWSDRWLQSINLMSNSSSLGNCKLETWIQEGMSFLASFYGTLGLMQRIGGVRQ